MPSLNELSPLIQANGPWSISKVGVIEQCSLKFDYKYGKEKFKEPYQPSDESLIGTIVHRALELALGGFKVSMAFNQALAEKEVLSNQRDAVMAFYQQVDAFVKRCADLRRLWGVNGDQNSVMVERKWGLKADFEWAGFFDKDVVFRGVVDYALLTAKNNLAIIDHKTGREHELEYYEAQFRSYCLLALARMPKLNAVHTGINFVMSDHMAWSPKVISAEQIREEYRPWLIAYISKACEGLKEPPTPKKQKLCDWCGYKPLCPAYGGAGRVDQKQDE